MHELAKRLEDVQRAERGRRSVPIEIEHVPKDLNGDEEDVRAHHVEMDDVDEVAQEAAV